jgi:hypothetical protein
MLLLLRTTITAVADARNRLLLLLLLLLQLKHCWLQKVRLLQPHGECLLQVLQQLLDVCTSCSISEA